MQTVFRNQNVTKSMPPSSSHSRIIRVLSGPGGQTCYTLVVVAMRLLELRVDVLADLDVLEHARQLVDVVGRHADVLQEMARRRDARQAATTSTLHLLKCVLFLSPLNDKGCKLNLVAYFLHRRCFRQPMENTINNQRTGQAQTQTERILITNNIFTPVTIDQQILLTF